MRISPATIDRVLRKDKAAPALRGKSLTKFAALLKHRIPIHTSERKFPGFIKIDTARHCGQASSGRYILTLTTTDVASGWICPLLPPQQGPLPDLRSPQGRPRGPPFGNSTAIMVRVYHQVITAWHCNPACPVPFTRSRDHRKNDNCFVGQKNGAVVRGYTGCDHLEGDALQSRLDAVYHHLTPSSTSLCPP